MEDDPKPAYVVDSSAWIDLRQVVLVPGVWALLERLANDGRLVVPVEVIREVYPSTDAPAKWIHDRKECHRDTEDLWDLAHEIADKYPDLVNYLKRGSADPFVIACAIAEKAKRAMSLFPCDVVVVANEKSKRPDKVAIPDACASEDVRCVTIEGWFEMEGWKVVGS